MLCEATAAAAVAAAECDVYRNDERMRFRDRTTTKKTGQLRAVRVLCAIVASSCESLYVAAASLWW